MRLKINSKKTSKKVCDKFACTEKSRTFAPAFGKEARRRAGRRIKKPCRKFGEEKNPPYFCIRFPLSSGHAVFEMFWIDKRSSV